MPAKLRRNAIVVCGLALFFAWVFFFAKHDPKLRSIIPFGDDPYDAIGSFAVIASVLLAWTSLARAFFPGLFGRSGAAIYVLRVQAAIPFCVLVTVAADTVAMGRHTSMWLGTPGQRVLLILLGMLVASSFGVLAFVRNSPKPGMRRERTHAAVVCLASLLILCVYPEKAIVGIAGHLLTVLFGDLLLFAPVAMLVKAWLPSTGDIRDRGGDKEHRHLRYLHLIFAAATGLVVGAIAFLGEMNDGGPTPPLAKLLFVAAVYLGLGMGGLMIGYVLLGRLLGFVVDGPLRSEQS